MIGWELPPFNSGGLGVASLGLAKALSEKGAKITFVLPRKLKLNYDFMHLLFANVEEAELLMSSYTTSHNLKQAFEIDDNETPWDYVNGALKFGESVGKVIKKTRFDLIHAHDWLAFPAGVMAKKTSGKPMVVHIHSTEYDRTGGHNPNPHVYKIEKNGMIIADKVLPVGGFMKNVLVNNYNIDPEKIKVVYNGIEENITNNLPPALSMYKEMGYKIILYLGRITLQKGPEYFVWTAKKVLQYYPKVLFVVTGSGDMQDYMIGEAGRLGILENFLFTGFLRGDEKNRIYQSADLYVMPSVSEPFGITSLEAAANGTPVLMSKQSGVSEIFSNALKADFWDIDEMANKILAVLNYDALHNDLINESGKEIKNFTWGKSADEVMEIYKQLLGS